MSSIIGKVKSLAGETDLLTQDLTGDEGAYDIAGGAFLCKIGYGGLIVEKSAKDALWKTLRQHELGQWINKMKNHKMKKH